MKDWLMLVFLWFIFVSVSLSRSEGIYKDGDVVLGALITVRHKDVEDKCRELKPQGLAYVEAMLYAIETINNDPTLLENTTLGYDIRDSCDSPTLANKYAFEFVTRNRALDKLYSSHNNSEVQRLYQAGEILRPITTVIGAGDSSSSVVIASMLQIGDIPLISPFATSEELSLPYFKTFFRPVPPDGQQAKALADIIDYFEWKYVTVIGVDTSYGRYGVMGLENEAQERGTFCIAQVSYFPSTGYQTKIASLVTKIKTANDVNVIVLWGDPTTSIAFLEEVRKQGVTGKTWLAPEGWSEATSLFKPKYMPIIGGFVGTKLRDYDLSRYKNHLFNLSYQTPRVRNHTWWREYWALQKQCSSQSSCDLTDFRITNAHFVNLYTAYLSYVIDAVYAAAHAIDAIIRCPKHRVDCPLTRPYIRPSEVLKVLRNVTFEGVTGIVQFNNNGDSIRSAAYDLVNLHPGLKAPMLQNVGHWTRGLAPRLNINGSAIYWTNGSSQVPESVCSRPCRPGFLQTETIMCCWKCIKCPLESISSSYSSPNCTMCPWDKMPDSTQSKCVDLPEINIKFTDIHAIVILVIAGIGALGVVFVIGVGIRYRATPVVKSTNREMSLLFLISILIGLAGGVCELLRPSDIICLITNPIYSFYFTLCISILFVKTNRLVNVFNVNLDHSSFGSRICQGIQNQFVLLFLLNGIAVVLLITWHVLDPPYMDIAVLPLLHIQRGCRDHRTTTGLILQGLLFAYEFALSLCCAYYAFKARKLPANFSEARFIAFAMYMQLLCNICYATLQNSVKGNFLATFSAAIIILSAYGFLVCMFVPKIYVIFKHPERNTAEYVKTIVANHTMRSNFSRVTVCSKNGIAKPRSETVMTVISALSSGRKTSAEDLSRMRKAGCTFYENESTEPSNQAGSKWTKAIGSINSRLNSNANGISDASNGGMHMNGTTPPKNETVLVIKDQDGLAAISEELGLAVLGRTNEGFDFYETRL